jgi:hypothetical protein
MYNEIFLIWVMDGKFFHCLVKDQRQQFLAIIVSPTPPASLIEIFAAVCFRQFCSSRLVCGLESINDIHFACEKAS